MVLVGLPASRVLKMGGVSMGASVSKIMVALASMTVPVGTSRLALIV